MHLNSRNKNVKNYLIIVVSGCNLSGFGYLLTLINSFFMEYKMKKVLFAVVASAALVFAACGDVSNCQSSGFTKEKLSNESAKYGYALGTDVAKNLRERDFDFDLDNWDLESQVSTEANSVTKGDAMVVKAIEGSNAAVAQATVQAIVSTAENSNKNLRTNAAMLFEQNERIFGGMHQDLSAIGATLTSMFKLQTAVLGNLDKNISAYQTESLKLENERNAILKEMLENNGKILANF